MDNSVLHCLQQLQKVVECSICLETMTNPVQTKCNHSFCSHCIHKAMAERPSFKCPLCKTAINKRLKKSSYLTEVISTLTTLNKSAHKEMHVEGVTEPKTTEKEPGVLKIGNNSRNMLKQSTSSKQPPGFAKGQSQVEDMNLIPRTEDQMTPDLLDFVETTKSPNGVKLDSKSTASLKLNLDKSAKKVTGNVAGGSENPESADTNPDELYDFPQSQPSTRGKVPVKKTRKAVTKKSAKKLIWDKSLTANQGRKKQEKGKKAKTSSPPLPVKSPTDIKMIENIKETESHKLVIENKRTCRSSSIEKLCKSKQTVAVMFVQSPKKITSTETTPDIQPVAVKPNLKAITKKCTKKQPKEVHFQDKDVTPPLAPLAVSATVDCCDSVPKNEATSTKHHTPGMETSSSIVAKCLKEHKHLTRRLIYAESSSDDDMMMPVSSVTDRNQTGYQDKVASWLKNVDPALEHTEITDGPKQLESIKDSDLEDMVSISQVLNEDSCKIVRRKKRNLPSMPVKTKLTSVIRNAEVFGDKKPKHKYSAKNKSFGFAKNLSESSAQLKESSNFVQALISNEKKITTRGSRSLRSSKKTNKKNIFDVPGLSQGVSPFTTPTKDGTTDTDSPAYPTVTENQPENVVRETSESYDMKNAHSSDQSGEIRPEKISDDMPEKISSTDQKSHEVEVPASNGDGNNGQSSENEKQNSNDQAGALHSKNIDMSDAVLKDSIPPKNATTEEVNSEKFLIKLKHTKAPKSKTITPPKSTPSSVGQRSGRVRNGRFSKTPPQKSPEHVLVAAYVTSPKTPPSQLENMPVICVGETEENTQDSKAYYVDTPPTTECSLLESNDCKKSETEKTDKVTKRQPVELGLLDFSGPSQSVELNSQPNKKIMETCRMVIDNLGSSKSEVLSENETGPLSDNLLVVGRSVNLTKVQSNNSDAEVATNTMKEIHEKLSQIEEPTCSIEGTHGVCGSPQKQENSVKIQGSSTYACDTDSSIANSTNVILNSEPTSNKSVSKNGPVVVKIKRTNVKARKVCVLPASRTIKKRGRPSKAVRRTNYKLKMNFASSGKKKLGKTIKTISDRLLEQKKLSQASTNSQSQVSDSVKEIGEKVPSSVEKTKDFCNESAADERNVTENENKSFPSTSSEDMMCTSNGWGGTKLKIRICRNSDHSPKNSSDAATKKQNVSNDKKIEHFLKNKPIENSPTSPAVIPNSIKPTSNNKTKIAKKSGPYSKKTKIPVSTCEVTDLISSSCPLPQTDDEFKQNDKIIRSFERSLSVNLIRCDIDTLHFTHPMPKVERKIQKGRRTGGKVESKHIESEDHIPSSPLLFPPSQEQTNEVQKSTDQHEKDTSDSKKDMVEEKKEDNSNKIDTNMDIVNENAGTSANSQEEEETDNLHLPENMKNFLSSLTKTLQLSKEIELSFPALVADFEKWREYCLKISHTLKLGEQTQNDSNQNLETSTSNKDQVMSDDKQSQPVVKPTEIDMDDEIDCSLPTVQHILNARERTQEMDNSSSKEKNVFVDEPILIGDKEDLVVIDEDQGLEDGNDTYLLDDNTPTLPESTGQSSVFPDQIQASPIQASQDMLPGSAGSTGNPVFKRSLLSLKRKRVLSSSSESCSPKQPKRKRIICNEEEDQSSQEFSNSRKSEIFFNEHFASQASEKSIDFVNSSLQSEPAHNLEHNEVSCFVITSFSTLCANFIG
ncbi:uncharacterized protein LOC100186860 isoform X2 [Ciona intestinalis]